MLATILKTKTAMQASIRIMDAFVSMRHYIGNNEYRILNVESKVIEYDNRIGYKTFSINLISDKDEYETFLNKVNKLI